MRMGVTPTENWFTKKNASAGRVSYMSGRLGIGL